MHIALPVDRKRAVSELVRVSRTFELLHRKEERAKQAPALRPYTLYMINIRNRSVQDTCMPINSLQRHVSSLTKTAKENISSLQFCHYGHLFHLFRAFIKIYDLLTSLSRLWAIVPIPSLSSQASIFNSLRSCHT